MDLPYIILIFILLIITYIEIIHPQSKIYLFAELVVVLFIGLRSPTVGADTLNYVTYFTGVKNFYNYDSRDLEALFLWYNNVLGSILFYNGTLYILFNTIISLSPIFYLINRYSCYKTFSVMLFFIGMFYTVYFIALRQIIGLSFLLWGCIVVMSNKRFKWLIYFCFSIIGFYFHETIIIFSLLYFLVYHINLKKKYWCVIVVLFFISRFLIVNIDINELINVYTSYQISLTERTFDSFVFQEAEKTLNIFSVIMGFLTALFVVFTLTESKINHWFVKIYILGYGIDCIFSNWPLVHRIEVSCTFFFVIVFTWIIKEKKRMLLSIVMYAIILFNFITYMKRNIVYDKVSEDRMHPYSTVIFDL